MDFPTPQFGPYVAQNRYPHMGMIDAQIWTRYIMQNPGAWDSVAYDVPCGEGTPHDTVVNAATGGDINRLYQRRIDVVAVTERAIWIIEIKPRASTASIGQVKAYAKLFKRDYAPTLPVLPLIITDELLPEMELLAQGEGVNLFVV